MSTSAALPTLCIAQRCSPGVAFRFRKLSHFHSSLESVSTANATVAHASRRAADTTIEMSRQLIFRIVRIAQFFMPMPLCSLVQNPGDGRSKLNGGRTICIR
jgi:hypothetical protein